jgi:hypothetical protein
MRPVSRTWLSLGALLALVSCRSILDIHPGTLDEGSDGSGGSGASTGATGATSPSGGSDPQVGEGGDGSPSGGKGGGVGNGGKSGSGQAGNNPTAGSVGDAGSGTGGADEGPTSLFPPGFCDDCIARNCAALHQACRDDAACAAEVPTWLACGEADANACVAADPAALHDLEACAAQSCDLCRHLDAGTPSVEIVTPSNGAQFTLDANGLIEVTVRVHNFLVKQLGTCGAEVDCGHIHINIDEGVNCRVTAFYNAWVTTVDGMGMADSIVDTKVCDVPITGKTVKLTASLSAAVMHGDRVPLVQSTVDIDIAE